MTSKPEPSVTVRDAHTGELDQVGQLLLAAYQEFAAHMPPDMWRAYASDITDVKGRLGDSELIVAQEGDRLVGAVTLYPDASRIRYTRCPPDGPTSGCWGCPRRAGARESHGCSWMNASGAAAAAACPRSAFTPQP